MPGFRFLAAPAKREAAPGAVAAGAARCRAVLLLAAVAAAHADSPRQQPARFRVRQPDERRGPVGLLVAATRPAVRADPVDGVAVRLAELAVVANLSVHHFASLGPAFFAGLGFRRALCLTSLAASWTDS